MSYPPFHARSDQPQPLFMSALEFARAFPGESEWIEFKTGFSADQIQQVAVAFSNVDGGVIVLGVAPDGSVAGYADSAQTRDRIRGTLAQARNLGRTWLHPLAVDDMTVIVISVAAREEGTAQTIDGRVLVRRGTEKVPLFGDELLAFMNARSLGRFETTTTKVSLDAIDPPLLDALADAFRWTRDDRVARLRERRLVARDEPTLTVAGALLLLADPSAALGKVYVELRRISAAGESELRLDIRGSIAEQIERTVAEVQRELGSQSVIVGARRRELPRLPPTVIREAVANALAHRSYEASGSAVLIEISPVEVTITSPGPLPEPVTVANIRQTQAARNPELLNALRRLRLAEDEGVGVDRIFDEMQSELLQAPTFIDTGSHVIVRLPTRAAATVEERAWLADVAALGKIDSSDRVVLVHALRNEHLTNARVRTLLNTSEAGARHRLARLVDLGMLVRHGERAATTYSIAASLPGATPIDDAATADAVLALAAQRGSVSNTDVRESLGIDRADALRVLQGLVTDGRLEQFGSRRGTRYAVPPNRT